MSGTLRRRKSLGDELNELRVDVQKLKIGRTAREDLILLNAVRLVQDRFDLINNGLQLRMPMDNSVVDRSGNSRDGTLNGTPTFVTGKAIFALSFPGDNITDFVDIPNTALNGFTDFTISVWIKTTDSTQNFYLSAFNGDNEFLIGITPDANSVTVFLDGVADVFAGLPSLTDGKFHHIVFKRTATEGAVFVDGGNKTTAAVDGSALVVSPGGLILGQEQDSLGGDFDPNQAFKGDIDEVRIWNRALSDDEILELFVFPVPQFHEIEGDAYLKAFIGFEGHVEDLSGFNRTVTRVGGTFLNGKFGKSLDFDGISNEVLVAHSADLNLVAGQDLSISFWIKTTDASTQRDIISKVENGNLSFYVMRLGVNAPAGKLMFQLTGPGGTSRRFSNKVINDGVYHHVVGTYDASTGIATVFIDGFLDDGGGAITTSNIVTGGANDLKIAKGTLSGGFLDAEIDEVRIYVDRILTTDEIGELFTNGRPSPRQMFMHDVVRANLNRSSVTDELFSLADVAPTSVECTEFFVGTVPAGATNCSVIVGRQGIVGTLDGV